MHGHIARTSLILLVAAYGLDGCSLTRPVPSQQGFAVDPPPLSYVARVQQMPVPTDEKARQDFCAGLRQDRARMVSGLRAPDHTQEIIADTAPPGDVGAAMGGLAESLQNISIENTNRTLRQNIAAIDQKMVDAACNMPHMPATPAKRSGVELEQCVATCQKVTGNDATACFKDCAQ